MVLVCSLMILLVWYYLADLCCLCFFDWLWNLWNCICTLFIVTRGFALPYHCVHSCICVVKWVPFLQTDSLMSWVFVFVFFSLFKQRWSVCCGIWSPCSISPVFFFFFFSFFLSYTHWYCRLGEKIIGFLFACVFVFKIFFFFFFRLFPPPTPNECTLWVFYVHMFLAITRD